MDQHNRPTGNDPLMATVQAILLAHERQQIEELKLQLQNLQEHVSNGLSLLEEREGELTAVLDAVRHEARNNQTISGQLQTEVSLLQHRARGDSEGLIARLTPVLGDLISRKIRDNRDEMADAFGPIMGEAIRVQIRDSRDDIIDALYPIIGSTVQKAVAEGVTEIQRNVDTQLRSTFGREGIWRTIGARLRGVSPSELALRDALPFHVRQMFLIQQQSGLLLAYTGDEEMADSDLISAMLTAIRDFVHDSFAPDQEDQLDQVQYGQQRIIVQSGPEAYLAVVFSGVEPEGFHAHLRQFISELHVAHGPALRNYDGDPTNLPHIQPKLLRLVTDMTGETKQPRPPRTRRQKVMGVIAAFAALIFLGMACFYLQFTIALLPVAFPQATQTAPPVPTVTPVPTATPVPETAVLINPTWLHTKPDNQPAQLWPLAVHTHLIVQSTTPYQTIL